MVNKITLFLIRQRILSFSAKRFDYIASFNFHGLQNIEREINRLTRKFAKIMEVTNGGVIEI